MYRSITRSWFVQANNGSTRKIATGQTWADRSKGENVKDKVNKNLTKIGEQDDEAVI